MYQVRKDSASTYPLRLYAGTFFNYIILVFIYNYLCISKLDKGDCSSGSAGLC